MTGYICLKRRGVGGDTATTRQGPQDLRSQRWGGVIPTQNPRNLRNQWWGSVVTQPPQNFRSQRWGGITMTRGPQDPRSQRRGSAATTQNPRNLRNQRWESVITQNLRSQWGVSVTTMHRRGPKGWRSQRYNVIAIAMQRLQGWRIQR